MSEVNSTEAVKTFLAEVKEKKVKDLMGIQMDIRYFESIVAGKDTDKLRKELAKEQQKVIKGAKGQVISDSRDIDKVNQIVFEIDRVEKASQELQRLRQMDRDMRIYIEFINSPDAKTKKAMKECAEL